MADMRIKVSKQRRKQHSQQQAREWNARMTNHEYTHRRMTFGKYTNWYIKDLPIDYLKWAILNFDNHIWLDWLCRELSRRDPSFKLDKPVRMTRNNFLS